MDITSCYVDLMKVISPVLILSGMLALTISVIVMLINMLINAFIGRGIKL